MTGDINNWWHGVSVP